MAFDKSFKAPAVLSGVAQATFEGIYESSIVSNFMPVNENAGLSFNFSENDTSLPRTAKYRSFNTRADQTVSGGSKAHQGKLPPISRRYNVDEYSHITLIGGDLGAEFEKKTTQIAAEIAMRLVVGAAEAIETGKLSIQENGLQFDIDFGRKAELTASAPTVWTDPAADVIGDLTALRQVYGSTPGSIIIPETVLWALARNVGIIKFVVQRGSDLPTEVTLQDVMSVLANFGFTGLRTNDERYLDHDDNEQHLFSQDKVLFLPGEQSVLSMATGGGSLGTLEVGIPAEALDPDAGVGKTPGLFAGALRDHDPEGYDVLVSTIALPVLRSANKTAALTVL